MLCAVDASSGSTMNVSVFSAQTSSFRKAPNLPELLLFLVYNYGGGRHGPPIRPTLPSNHSPQQFSRTRGVDSSLWNMQTPGTLKMALMLEMSLYERCGDYEYRKTALRLGSDTMLVGPTELGYNVVVDAAINMMQNTGWAQLKSRGMMVEEYMGLGG